MPRKLQLTQKKNFERKKSAAHKQLTVRISTVILQKATIKNWWSYNKESTDMEFLKDGLRLLISAAVIPCS